MTVEPIRSKVKINQMHHYLKGKDDKYALLFKFGLNTGLRISDMLPLKMKNVCLDNGSFKEYLIIKEKKTSKEKKIKINNALKNALSEYIKRHNLTKENYLFPSQKGGHIGRVQSYRFLREAAETVGIENFGTHSLRKTWGYWTYKLSKYNIGLIMDTFNHSNQKITLRYIGINQDQKDDLYTLVQF
ncbi:tyrosine-type recombinase/integrase [Anaerocolumna sp. AGMB13025]|uniref:tyrosine-type recombinase/integrase n=1 Tax=Anaerocolumna sp. AGMB13025 TaxID=3039116 RepID=UPI002420175D|nr:tyrosine-type recombinase/integrase [Anaerocolumna sp. AGMB13025]WFR56505.1 tyrosine-type recombinase/integrase [Anaerocolumna sp. AGMB13025]